MRIKKLNQRGDTIVEVLLSISIISMILGGAYVTANNSYNSTRRAEEQTDALKVSESQLEQLKDLVSTNPSAVFGAGAPGAYCISAGAAVDAANATCAVNSAGVPTTSQPAYKLSISRSGNTFTLVTTWSDVRGNVNDRLQLTYRAYQ